MFKIIAAKAAVFIKPEKDKVDELPRELPKGSGLFYFKRCKKMVQVR